MKLLLTEFALLFSCIFSAPLYGQEEFPKGWVMYLEGMQGASTSFHSSPDTYVGNLQLTPQVTVIPNHLRLSAVTGLAFNNKKLYAAYGAGVNWKLSTIGFNSLGSLLNLQVQVQHIWGTGKQKLVGGGVKAEVGKLFLMGISAHRDYKLNAWWLQGGIGFNLLRKKAKAQDPFE